MLLNNELINSISDSSPQIINLRSNIIRVINAEELQEIMDYKVIF